MTMFRFRAILCVIGLITAPIFPSNITTGLITPPISPSNITGLIKAPMSPSNITTGLITATISPSNITGLIKAPISPSNITTGLITATISQSNITTTNVTETDLTGDTAIENVTINHRTDPNGDDLEVTDDNTRKMFVTINSHVFRFYIPIGIMCGVVSCVTTILVLLKNNLKSSADVYIIGNASVNLIYVLNYIPLDLNYFDVFKRNRQWQSFYSYYVAFLFPLLYVAMAANAWTVMAFAVERLLVIIYPFKARTVCRRSRAAKVVICIFVLALITNGTAFFARSVRVEIDPITNETIHRSAYTEFSENQLITRVQYCFYAIAAVIVPVILLGVFNIAILVNLRRVRRKQMSLKQAMADSDHNKNVQIERVLIAYVSAFFICSIMLATTVGSVAIYGFAILRKFSLEYKIRLLMSRMLYILNPSVNFVVNVCCSKIYRDTVKACLLSLVCCDKSSQSSSLSAKKPLPGTSTCPTVSDYIDTTTMETRNKKE